MSNKVHGISLYLEYDDVGRSCSCMKQLTILSLFFVDTRIYSELVVLNPPSLRYASDPRDSQDGDLLSSSKIALSDIYL